MPLILVAADPEAGATTVAVALAQRLAHAGRPARLERLAGDERAEGDAAVFAALEFATSSGSPVERGDLTPSDDDVVVAEAPAGADAAALAGELGARLIAVRRADRGEVASSNGALSLLTHARTGGALVLPEDRLLAAPTVGSLIAASGAQVLVQSIEGAAAVCEHIVIGAIALDAADAYFSRYQRTAVVTRAEKVDVALAALRTEPECLILTGGGEPSPYLLDWVASARSTTLLLASQGTVETVRDIEGSFGRSPFSGEAKVERAGALLAEALDDAALERLLGG